jgi:hypothetical protein
MVSCETFENVTIDPDSWFDNKVFRTLLGRMGTEVRTVPTDAHWDSHAEKPVNLLRVAFTKIAAKHAKLSLESVLALTVRSANSMKCRLVCRAWRLIAVGGLDTPLCPRNYMH